MRRRLAAARVARLATADDAGRPHVVPICFVLSGDTVYFAVDAKPKSGRPLKRLQNIAANSAVSLLVDDYDDDWSRLWWVRADGTARVVGDGAESQTALERLAARYPQYRRTPPPGPVVAIAIARLSGWSAA